MYYHQFFVPDASLIPSTNQAYFSLSPSARPKTSAAFQKPLTVISWYNKEDNESDASLPVQLKYPHLN